MRKVMGMAKTPDLLGAAEAAESLGIDRSTLLRWAKSGRLKPAMQVGPGRTSAFLFRRQDIESLKTAEDAA